MDLLCAVALLLGLSAAQKEQTFSQARRASRCPQLKGRHAIYIQTQERAQLELKVGGHAYLLPGTALTVRCPIKRFPKSSIRWFKDGAPLGKAPSESRGTSVTRRGTMMIKSLRAEHVGVYECFAGSISDTFTLQLIGTERTAAVTAVSPRPRPTAPWEAASCHSHSSRLRPRAPVPVLLLPSGVQEVSLQPQVEERLINITLQADRNELGQAQATQLIASILTDTAPSQVWRSTVEEEKANEVSVCIRANAQTCGECIQVSESCGWCSAEWFLQWGQEKSVRCDDLQSLLERRCPPSKIENPRGSIQIEKNEPLTNRTKDSPEKLTLQQIIQIQPQKLSLTLRAGEPQTFSLKFKRAEDYPIDLYYLMDLSSSMKDDLENVKNLGTDLMKEMQEITSDFRIGFGSIVKTPMTPARLANRCPGNQNCPGSFIFQNVLKLTDKGDEFNRLVSQQQISDNMASPEGGYDAIMQVAMCEEQIGWRKDAVRLLVVSTDVGFHFRGEGRLLPQCQLQNDTYTNDGQVSDDHPEQTQSDRSSSPTEVPNLLVSPSPAQLANTLSQHNIQTIFTVTENVLPVYKELTDHIPKSTVGTMTSNSSNVLELIIDAYKSPSSEVILENSRLPEGVSISYKSLCKNGVEETGESGRKCSNISIGDEVSFEISITAQNCLANSKAEVIKMKALGFNEEVEVVLNLICECECSAERQPQSDKCSGLGAFECGNCNCNPGRVGAECQCDIEAMFEERNCRKDGGADICSNNGDCICGICECKKRENPMERYSGQYCECDNFNCDRSGNKLCGGHGRCECRMCVCDANYTGSACDCSLDPTPCLAKNGQICNGRGTCECGACKCTDPKFQGPTCEICPTCPGVCSKLKECVLCRVFGTGPKMATCDSNCNYLTLITVNTPSDLPEPFNYNFPLSHCKERDEDDCWFYYAYSLHDGTERVYAVKKKDCPTPYFWG